MTEERFNPTKYKNDFQKEKYDRLIVNVPKGEGDIIKEEAKLLGYRSYNAFVVDAIGKMRKEREKEIEEARKKVKEEK